MSERRVVVVLRSNFSSSRFHAIVASGAEEISGINPLSPLRRRKPFALCEERIQVIGLVPRSAGLVVLPLTMSQTPMISTKVMDIDRQVWKFAFPRTLSICGMLIDFVPVVVLAIVAPVFGMFLERGGGLRLRAAGGV